MNLFVLLLFYAVLLSFYLLFLQFVLEDERLNQSEALYAFLSPSSEHLKAVVAPSPKKSRFSLSTLFKTYIT